MVDWIYPSLSAQDKATIRRVFLRWSQEVITRGYHHPEPVGMTNDPALLADPQQVRFSGNNYYAAHMRNLGLMALALDPADDADGALRAYLDNAAGRASVHLRTPRPQRQPGRAAARGAGIQPANPRLRHPIPAGAAHRRRELSRNRVALRQSVLERKSHRLSPFAEPGHRAERGGGHAISTCLLRRRAKLSSARLHQRLCPDWPLRYR